MSPDAGSVSIYLLIIVVLLILNALTESSRRALDLLDRNKIKNMLSENKKSKRTANVIELIKKPSKYHYADLLMNFLVLTVCELIINFRILTDYSLRVMIISNIIFFIVYTAFANILPKKLAAQKSESYAASLSNFQEFIYLFTLPIVKICVGIANVILIILRKSTDVDDTYYSEDSVMSMLDKGQESGEIKEEGKKMINSIFEFDDLLAYEIMTPRTDVFMIDLQDSIDEYFDQLMELRYSRIPVCDGDNDNVIGILHIKDYLLQASCGGFNKVDIKEIMRKPYFVPETKNIDSLFIELQKEKQHIALLIDEYGGFRGLVSIEDIIEQIVGDIDDEFDQDDRIIEKKDDNTYIIDGNVYIDDLYEETGIHLESDTSETIGGFIIDLMGDIPKEDVSYEPIIFENYKFQILEVKDRRIEKLQIVITDVN